MGRICTSCDFEIYDEEDKYLCDMCYHNGVLCGACILRCTECKRLGCDFCEEKNMVVCFYCSMNICKKCKKVCDTCNGSFCHRCLTIQTCETCLEELEMDENEE